MIVLKKINKSFGNRKVLSDISFQINPGEFVCITGPSGAGKSTLVHILAGAQDVNGGSIEVDGVDLRSVPPMALRLFRRRVGVVFQDYKLLPHFTVRENISFPLEVCGAPNTVIKKRVTELLKQMELKKVADALPQELSGGEKARTAIARAIVHEPMVLLADEPTGNLDPDQSKNLLKLFQAIHKGGTTVVLATHDTELVNTLRTRVIRLEEGSVVRDSKGHYRSADEKSSPKHLILSEKPSKASEKPSEPKRKVKITSVAH